MGNTVSAIEKATVDALMKLAQKKGETVDRSLLVNLLYWAKRRGFLKDSADVFKEATWQVVGADLWEAIQTGNKEAKSLASTYRQLRMLIEQMGAEIELELTAQTMVTAVASKFTQDPAPTSYVSAPATCGPYDDLIPPWDPIDIHNVPAPAPLAPPAAQDAVPTNPDPVSWPPPPPDIDPAIMPLPEETNMDAEDLQSTLQKQTELMTKLLGEMKRLDKGSKNRTIREAYKKAHDAILSSLKTLEENSFPAANTSKDTSQRREHILNLVKAGEWDMPTANQFLTSKGLPPIMLSEIENVNVSDPTEKGGMGLLNTFNDSFNR